MSTIRTTTCLGLLGLLAVSAGPASGQSEDPPETVEITGIVRDFKMASEMGGHPDFENNPGGGMARYAGVIGHTIGDDGKPYFDSIGNKITSQWRDAQNRQISYVLFENFPQPGDVAGSFGQAGTGGITSAKSFSQWFRDVPVYNLSMPLTLTLRLEGGGLYVFDDLLDPEYASLGGFFPIDGLLFGNTPGNGNGNGGGGGNQGHNFHFTFEVHAEFQYDASADQSFKFEGTDSVWLFIDGHLVNDLVGVHASHDQYVDVHRLGLVDGEWYPLDFYFAQRYQPQSHFRIETSLLLESVPITTISAVFD